MHTKYLSNILPDVYYHLRRHLAAENLTMKAVVGPDEFWTVSFLNRAEYKASGLTLRIPPASETKRSIATWSDVSIRIHLEGLSVAANLQPEHKLKAQVRSLSRPDVAQHLQTTMENARTFSIDKYNLATRRNLDPEPMWVHDIVVEHLDRQVARKPSIDAKGDITFEIRGTHFKIAFQLEKMKVTADGKHLTSIPTNDTANLTWMVARFCDPHIPTYGWSGLAGAVSDIQDQHLRQINREIEKQKREKEWEERQANLQKEWERKQEIQKKFEGVDDVASKDHVFDPESLSVTRFQRVPEEWGMELDSFWEASTLYALHNRDKKIGVVGVQNNCVCAYYFFHNGPPSPAAWKSVQQMAEEKKLHVVQNPRFLGGSVVDSEGTWHLEGEIPTGTSFSTSLVLSGFDGVGLPDDLKVAGSLTLGRHYKQLPKGLEATVLDVSHSAVEVIPGDCRVTSRLRANKSKVRMICDGFTATHVDLRETLDLESLPDGFDVKSLDLTKSGIRKLNNLITDQIDLTDSCVEEVSDTVILRHRLLDLQLNTLEWEPRDDPRIFG